LRVVERRRRDQAASLSSVLVSACLHFAQ
jgi:hypothetical protein